MCGLRFAITWLGCVLLSSTLNGQGIVHVEDTTAAPSFLHETAAEQGASRWSLLSRVEATYLKLEPFNDVATENVVLDLQPAPRLTLGFLRDDGWGIQSRYWQYATDFDAQLIEPNLALIQVDVGLDLYYVDLEAVRMVQGRRWGLQATFGGRHASIERRVVGVAMLTDAGNVLVGAANQTDGFFGGGLTGSLEFTRSLGDSPWQLFANCRGSALWGRESRHATGANINNGVLVSFSESSDASATQAGLESQLGLQWSHDLHYLHGTLVCRTAVEYQLWNTSPEGVAANNRVPDVELYGVAWSIGFTH